MLVAGIQPRRRVEPADLGILLAVVRDQYRNGGGQTDAVIELAQAADADVRDGLIVPFAEVEINREGRRAEKPSQLYLSNRSVVTPSVSLGADVLSA